MELELSVSEGPASLSLEKIGSFIISIQKEHGEIPWSAGGKPIPGIMWKAPWVFPRAVIIPKR